LKCLAPSPRHYSSGRLSQVRDSPSSAATTSPSSAVSAGTDAATPVPADLTIDVFGPYPCTSCRCCPPEAGSTVARRRWQYQSCRGSRRWRRLRWSRRCLGRCHRFGWPPRFRGRPRELPSPLSRCWAAEVPPRRQPTLTDGPAPGRAFELRRPRCTDWNWSPLPSGWVGRACAIGRSGAAGVRPGTTWGH
jgi:hypothetical protein